MFKVKAENLKQLEIILSSKKVREIILSRDSFAECDLPKLVGKIKKSGKLAWILMERISRYEENMKPIGANTKIVGANAKSVGANAKIVGANACGARIRKGELCEPASMDLRTSTDKIYEIKNLDGIIIQNLDSFAYMLRKINKAANQNLMVELNYTMNCYNNETKKVLETLYNEKRNNAKEVPLLFTAPLELNTYELSDVGYDTMILYSYIDTMVSANCLRKTTEVTTSKPVVAKHRDQTCKYRFDFNNIQDFSSYIIDRKGKKLHYKTYCKYCYNKIFNTEPLFLLDKIEEIKQLKILRQDEHVDHKVYGDVVGANTCGARRRGELCEPDKIVRANQDTVGVNFRSRRRGELCEPSYRIDFSFENEKEVKDILSMKCPESFTRGHYKSSIK